MQTITIRKEITADIPHIEAVTEAAFKNAEHTSHTEHFIVNALRHCGRLSLSLVAVQAGNIIGHVAISPVSISGKGNPHAHKTHAKKAPAAKSESIAGWYGLGPISVQPELQRQGIGKSLMQAALTELKSLNAAGCVVLGDPAYYSRFGFKVCEGLTLAGVPPEYFQAICFKEAPPRGEVFYHVAFEATSNP